MGQEIVSLFSETAFLVYTERKKTERCKQKVQHLISFILRALKIFWLAYDASYHSITLKPRCSKYLIHTVDYFPYLFSVIVS